MRDDFVCDSLPAGHKDAGHPVIMLRAGVIIISVA